MNFRNVFITICTWPRFAVADHCLYIEQMALCRGAFPASRLPCDQLFIYIDVSCNIFCKALLALCLQSLRRRFAYGAFGADLPTAPVCPRRRFAYGVFGAGLPTFGYHAFGAALRTAPLTPTAFWAPL